MTVAIWDASASAPFGGKEQSAIRCQLFVRCVPPRRSEQGFEAGARQSGIRPSAKIDKETSVFENMRRETGKPLPRSGLVIRHDLRDAPQTAVELAAAGPRRVFEDKATAACERTCVRHDGAGGAEQPRPGYGIELL